MSFTLYRRPDAPSAPAPMFDPVGLVDVDPLTGAVPTWRLDEEPIYLEVIRDLGVPGLAEPAGPVVEGVVFPNPINDPDEIVPTPDDAPPTRALRLAPAPAVDERPDECPDCGAVDPNPCRPKSDPVHGRALTRQHRRRRALAEAGRGEFALVLLVLAVVVGIAVSVGSFLSSALGPVEGPLCAVPTAAGCPDGPRP